MDGWVLGAASALSVVASLLLLRHVARRYPSAPRRVPLRIGFDGRPSRRSIGKWILWFAPVTMVVLTAVFGVLLFTQPAPAGDVPLLVLVQITIIEVAWLVAWSTDRQIELARKVSYRLPPARLLRVSLPLIVTIAITVIVGMLSPRS